MFSYRFIVNSIDKRPTDIWGLNFFPSVEPFINDNDEIPRIGLSFAHMSIPEITDDNLNLVEEVVKEMGDKIKTIVEIGINRNGDRSISQILMHKKPKDATYVGIDIDDRKYLNKRSKNIYTLKADSTDQKKVRKYLQQRNVEKIDLLLIDGNHSVNYAVNDWKYADMLSDHGVVILHDTNFHTGSLVLPHAVDKNLFDVKRYFDNETDQGMVVCYRK